MAKGTVLIVDDEESVHLFLASVLRDFEQVSAYGGWEALEVVSDRAIDVVLMDLNLSATSGLEVMRKMRAAGSAVPVIVLSGHPSKDAAREARELGALEFLDKSCESYTQLPSVLERALARGAGLLQDQLGAALARELLAAPELAELAAALEGKEGSLEARRLGSLYRRLRTRFQQIIVRLVLERVGGDKRAAARTLGVSVPTVRTHGEDGGED